MKETKETKGMTTSIEIRDFRIQAFHGVLPQERTVGNLYSIDLTIFTDFTAAMTTDTLPDTIDYGEAVAILREEMLTPSQLLEHVGGRIVRRIKERWGERVQGIELAIGKLRPPMEAEIESAIIRIKI